MHKNKHTQHASGGYRDNYQNGDGSTNSTDNHSYERNRRSYDRDYSAYGSDSTNWKQRGSSWYEDFPTSASGGGYESTAWSGDGRYREYPVHEDSYSASSSGFYRSNSGKLDGSYGYDGYYRSISADLGGSYTNERSTSVPSSSSNAYYGADAYSSTRYDYSGYNAHYEGQGYGTDGRCADKFGRTGKYGFSSAYRAGTTTTTASTSAAGGRYANTFKTKQYSFGNKRNNRNKVGGAATGESNGCSVTPKEGEAQEEQKEPEKPKIIDGKKENHQTTFLGFFYKRLN